VSGETILRVEDLRHHYPARGALRGRRSATAAVDGIDFEVRRGESFGIVGESGSGKSTVARIVSGLRRPTSGVVEFEDRPLYEGGADPRWLRPKLQIVLQDPYSSLNPRARVATILSRPLIVRGTPARQRQQRIRELLGLVGLPEALASRYPSDLSGGQRQRVAIARALAVEPAMLVLDEPTSALDVSTQGQVVNLLAELQARLGLTYVFVSHNLALVAYFCDRTLVMHRGQAVETGSATDLYYHPRHEYTRQLMASVVTPKGR
jgi:ABC-type glutathione transport system ATPase component